MIKFLLALQLCFFFGFGIFVADLRDKCVMQEAQLNMLMTMPIAALGHIEVEKQDI